MITALKSPPCWKHFFNQQKKKSYWSKLDHFLTHETREYTVFPEKENIFKSFDFVSPKNLKVVILGQDPYVNEGEATGLAFGVPEGIKKVPPSLKNIFKEIESEYGKSPSSTDLTGWAMQGVLLLNTVLTVREGQRNSHANFGWEFFMDEVFNELSTLNQPIVFLLWGGSAEKFSVKVTNPHHLVLKSAHPSPLSVYRGFFGCNHFKDTNKFLRSHHLGEVEWIHSGTQKKIIKEIQGELF